MRHKSQITILKSYIGCVVKIKQPLWINRTWTFADQRSTLVVILHVKRFSSPSQYNYDGNISAYASRLKYRTEFINCVCRANILLDGKICEIALTLEDIELVE